MRAIDADALLDALYDNEFQTFCPLDEVSDVIDGTPTLDCEPVRHGEWKVFMVSRGSRQYVDSDLICSVCSHSFVRLKGMQMFNYCPNCGVKMDGGKEDG